MYLFAAIVIFSCFKFYGKIHLVFYALGFLHRSLDLQLVCFQHVCFKGLLTTFLLKLYSAIFRSNSLFLPRQQFSRVRGRKMLWHWTTATPLQRLLCRRVIDASASLSLRSPLQITTLLAVSGAAVIGGDAACWLAVRRFRIIFRNTLDRCFLWPIFGDSLPLEVGRGRCSQH